MTQPNKQKLVSESYDAIDRFLRNNLDDSDYSEYSAYLESVLASAPEVGEAVEMDENTAKRFRGILSMLGISAPESDESLMLCQFSLLDMMRHKIQQIYDHQARTAHLDADNNRLVELSNELAKELREARDDVNECLNADLPNAGYPRYDRRIEFRQQHLQRIDALLAEMEAKG